MALTYSLEKFKTSGVPFSDLDKFIEAFKVNRLKRFQKNLDYYLGQHEILKRKKDSASAPNNRVVCNHAKDITDIATGYFMGNPINYTTAQDGKEETIKALKTQFDEANVDEVDSDNAQNMSIFGVAYEYVYTKTGETVNTVKALSPLNTFIVTDDTIESNPLFGVYFYETKDTTDAEKVVHTVIATSEAIYEGILLSGIWKETLSAAHHFGGVPIIEYRNNKECRGDFEGQIGLIDAYNKLQSDRVDDKDQFIDSILAIYGAILGDTPAEKSEAMTALKENKMIELPLDAKAEYLTHTFDESGMEILRKSISEDIYKFSHVPCLSDENFLANTSGVAMAYKLLGLEMITKTKERYYKAGLRKRIRLFNHYSAIKGQELDPNLVHPIFSRSLPQNLPELAQTIQALRGLISDETLIAQIPFVTDPAAESEKAKANGGAQPVFTANGLGL